MGEDKQNEDVECTTALFHAGRYKNPWDTWRSPGLWGLLKFVFVEKDHSKVPKASVLDETLPVVKPNLSAYDTSPDSGVRHMWIGHASSLVQLDGVTFLTDPIFSVRCSPSQYIGGPKRYRPPPCTIEQLPKVDCVVISHNHYDHLDYNSVVSLNKRFGNSLKWFVPAGNKSWMTDSGCENVAELTWWQEETYPGPQGDIRFVCTPCQHWSKRTATNDNKSLWSSWCVIGPKHRFFFAGDTGYCKAFKQIGKRYGPFDLSTIPIGAYCPRNFLSPQHVDPAEAVDIHLDTHSKTSVGIHWGTFVLSREFYLEPREKIKEELKKRGMDATSFLTVNHGEIKVL